MKLGNLKWCECRKLLALLRPHSEPTAGFKVQALLLIAMHTPPPWTGDSVCHGIFSFCVRGLSWALTAAQGAMFSALQGKGHRGFQQSLNSCDPQSHKDRLNLPSAGDTACGSGVASQEGSRGTRSSSLGLVLVWR